MTDAVWYLMSNRKFSVVYIRWKEGSRETVNGFQLKSKKGEEKERTVTC